MTKLTYVALALCLLPSSLAFVPSSSKTKRQTATSLNGFFQDFVRHRNRTTEKEKEEIFKRFENPIKNGIVGDFLPPTPEEEAEAMENDLKTGVDFKHMPTHSQTGVDVHICRLAATLSRQLYHIHKGKKEKLMLSTDKDETEVVLLDKQGVFGPTNPTFAACVSGDTMLLGWRGTATLPDGVNDVAWSPTSSVAWRKHAKNLKLQGAMASLCLNDIANHEDMIIKECKKRGIKEIVTTGHSLGGGIGQIGHTILRAQIQDENSPWSELKGINVRSIVFCAPMTTVIVEDGCSKETEAFIDELDENSCNIVFYNDPVPRGYGYLTFINDFVDDAIPAIGPYLIEGKRLTSMVIKRKIERFASLQQEQIMKSEAFKELVDVLCHYVHPGKICFYADEEAKPRTLKDLGAFDDKKGRRGTFRSAKYKPIKRWEKKNPIDVALACHGTGRNAIAYEDQFMH